MRTIDLTPDPRVLLALTHTPLQPLDALCELVDNSIDSFADAQRIGQPVEFPLVVVDLPGAAETRDGAGVIRIRGNGPGMEAATAEKALRAGYSGKRRFGSLGLFGMGFNIATGKLGRRTLFTTVRRGHRPTSIEIDLPKIIESGSYEVPVLELDESKDFLQGTRIEINNWWPEGNPNHGFVKKLVGYSKDTIRRELGRRYATTLRKNRIRLVVNGEGCSAFEHCVWDESRYVERQGAGKIPARIAFDEVLAFQTSCVDCDELIAPGSDKCTSCDSMSFRTVEERINGWVGIQRFDDARDFGIDLIRNGRAIRIFEQAAFFDFTDEFKKAMKDYPIDGPYGRIVGEVSLDHVPVDFNKQDFQRNTEEWRRAITFLRGDSSLQPTQPNADNNHSPIFRLYQGFRRVRTPGRRDMYMGYVDAGKPKRISREIERDYYAKFLERLPGFFDDAEWWKLVEQADQGPTDDLVACPSCGAQHLKDAEICQICSETLIAKDCIKCSARIPSSALSCPICGESQLPEVAAPWRCAVCDSVNGSSQEICGKCNKARGTANPTAMDFLNQNSDRDDSLSLPDLVVPLADGTRTTALSVNTCIARQAMRYRHGGEDLPVVTFRAATSLDIFLDTNHRLFRALEIPPEVVVCTEVASFLFEAHRSLVSQYPIEHSVTIIAQHILDSHFSSVLEANSERVKSVAQTLFDSIRLFLSRLDPTDIGDLASQMTEEQSNHLVSNLLSEGRDLNAVPTVLQSGEFIRYVDDSTVVDIFKRRPRIFFDGRVFATPFETADLPAGVLSTAQLQIGSSYLKSHTLQRDLLLRDSETTNRSTFVTSRSAAARQQAEAVPDRLGTQYETAKARQSGSRIGLTRSAPRAARRSK